MPDRIELGGFSAESKKIIRQLEDYGWTFRISRQGHAIGHAPDGETRTSISKNLSRANRSQQAAEATVKRWERHLEAQAEAAKVEKIVNAIGDDPEVSLTDAVLMGGLAKHAAKMAQAQVDTDPPPSVVSRKPWLARQGTHREKGTTSLYESGAVVEVTYSDGSTDYECSVESCDYTSDNPRSVSSHFRAHVRAGEAEPVGHLARPSVARDVPIDPESIGTQYPGKGYTPSDRLVQALAAYLDIHGWEGASPEQIATFALTWAHERPDLGDIEAREREPLTDTQIVERIRLLVGGRDPETEEAYRNALTTIETMRTEHAAEVERLTGLLDLSNAEVVRLAQTLDTLGSLAREVGTPRVTPSP